MINPSNPNANKRRHGYIEAMEQLGHKPHVISTEDGAWFDADFKPTIDSDEWKAAINFYVDLLGNYGPPGSEGNSFNEILALYNEGKCGMWIDATIAASFLTVDGVAYAQSPNAGNPVGANWL